MERFKPYNYIPAGLAVAALAIAGLSYRERPPAVEKPPLAETPLQLAIGLTNNMLQSIESTSEFVCYETHPPGEIDNTALVQNVTCKVLEGGELVYRFVRSNWQVINPSGQ